jgi:hypothetical protein
MEHVKVCMYVCMYVYVYVCMSVCVCRYVCMYVCMYVCLITNFFSVYTLIEISVNVKIYFAVLWLQTQCSLIAAK